MTDFAERWYLSSCYFGELVRVETSQTAKELIAGRLLSHAKQLLDNLSLSIRQVSKSLGFDYPQHFVRFFKGHTGQTPRQYRSAS